MDTFIAFDSHKRYTLVEFEDREAEKDTAIQGQLFPGNTALSWMYGRGLGFILFVVITLEIGDIARFLSAESGLPRIRGPHPGSIRAGTRPATVKLND